MSSNRSELFLMAEEVLNETRKQFALGSVNITAIKTDENIHSDRITLFPSLFENKSTPPRQTLDALIDDPIDAVSKKRITENREKLIKETILRQNFLVGVSKFLEEINLRLQHAERSAATGSGNCGEMALYAFLKIMEKKYKGSVEYVGFREGDHDFIVINRPRNSEIENWKSWGPDTVILDPWLNKVFPATKLKDYLKYYINQLNSKYLLETFLRFNETDFKQIYYKKIERKSLNPKI